MKDGVMSIRLPPSVALLMLGRAPYVSATRETVPLPLTERPFEPDLVPPRLSPPPPPPTSALPSSPLSWAHWPAGAIVARTRITTSISGRGSTELSVKLSSGFHNGLRVIINPGGQTEEHSTLLGTSPFTLAVPLRHAHGPGETVLQLAPVMPVEAASMGVGVRARVRPSHAIPSPPRREAPLLGNLTFIARSSSLYVRSHVGIEAATALVVAGILTLGALAYVAQSFAGYSLCCFSRGRKPPRTPRLTQMRQHQRHPLDGIS